MNEKAIVFGEGAERVKSEKKGEEEDKDGTV